MQALIVHEGRQVGYGQRDFAFTTHEVEHSDSGVQLGAGRLLSLEDQQNLLQILLGALSKENGFLSNEVLSHSPAQIAWYVPGRRRPMWFRDGARTQRFNVPWPTLVFRVREGRLALVALSRAKRPKAQDPVFHAPLMNVFVNTELCVGSATAPQGWSLAQRGGYEKLVFDTAFAHVNHEHTLRILGGVSVATAEHLRFWRQLAREARPRFPTRALVPLPQCLGVWLER